MRRVGLKRIVFGSTTLVTPPDSGLREVLVAEAEPSGDFAAKVLLSSEREFVLAKPAETDIRSERHRQLEIAIRQRIESRLSGRVRNLNVRVHGATVVLDGQCATYYTKQLAQHAALGVLEDEQLENAIVVGVPR